MTALFDSRIFQKAPWLLFLPLFGVLGITLFLGYHYFRLVKEAQPPPSPVGVPKEVERRYRQESAETIDKIREEMATFSPLPVTLKEECFNVPIFANEPYGGSYFMDNPEPYIFDFHYEGYVVDVVDRTVGDCQYSTIVLTRNEYQYELNIPKGIISSQRVATGFPQIYPEVLKNYKGKFFQLQIYYQSDKEKIPANESKTPTLKFLEWEVGALRVDL